MKTVQILVRLIVLPLLLVSLTGDAAFAAQNGGTRNYIKTEQYFLVGAGSAATLGLNYLVWHVDSTRNPLISSPLPGETWLGKVLGGKWHPGKTNWLDNSTGSALTPALGGIGLIAANLTWPEGKPWKDAGQDFFLYHSGIWATKGVTGFVKGIVARPRPYFYYHPNEVRLQRDWDPSYARKSFFSGHASSAFYSMTYLNKRVLSIMRQRLVCNDYNNWRWLPPTIGFSWATYVAWTRLHAYKHYFSDVVVGAAAGVAIAELFFWIGERLNDESIGDGSSAAQMIFQFNFAF